MSILRNASFSLNIEYINKYYDLTNDKRWFSKRGKPDYRIETPQVETVIASLLESCFYKLRKPHNFQEIITKVIPNIQSDFNSILNWVPKAKITVNGKETGLNLEGIIGTGNDTFYRLVDFMSIEVFYNLFKEANKKHLDYSKTENTIGLALLITNSALRNYVDKDNLNDFVVQICFAHRILINNGLIGGKLNSDAIMIQKIKKGASKGGQTLHKDNLPFKEKYRTIRDSAEHQGKSREKHIDLAGVAFDTPFATLERWAKEADKEDGFIRKAGRPSNKKG